MSDLPEIKSFLDIESWLKGLPDQVMGLPSAICETGEPYVGFIGSALSRPSDVKVIEAEVAREFCTRLYVYLGERSGRLYLRTLFESAIEKYPIVIRYDEHAGDYDPLTKRKYVFDNDWFKVQCRIRLYKAFYKVNDANYDAKQQPAIKVVGGKS